MNDKNTNSLLPLSIFHFVVAIISLACIFFPLIYLIVGISMEANYQMYEPVSSGILNIPLGNGQTFTLTPSGLPRFGGMVLVIVFLLIFAVCMMLAGIFILKKRHFFFCKVMSIVAFAFPIFGGILGVVSFLKLSQPSTRKLFEN